MFDWCWYQIDTKILVVHSSVVHIELLLRSRITILKVGFFRSYTYSDSCSWNMLSWVILSWGMKHLISINAVHSPNLIIWFKANFINSESLKRTESKSNHLAPSKVSRFSRSRSPLHVAPFTPSLRYSIEVPTLLFHLDSIREDIKREGNFVGVNGSSAEAVTTSRKRALRVE